MFYLLANFCLKACKTDLSVDTVNINVCKVPFYLIVLGKKKSIIFSLHSCSASDYTSKCTLSFADIHFVPCFTFCITCLCIGN